MVEMERKMEREISVMPPGTYYVGDLCYVLGDRWDEVCDLVIGEGHSCRQGKFTLSDGTEFVMFNTKYGDGEFRDLDGLRYPVDAGSIGAVLNDKITDENADRQLGQILTFGSNFSCFSDDGEIHFGAVVIDTAGYDDNYDFGDHGPTEYEEWRDYDPDC